MEQRNIDGVAEQVSILESIKSAIYKNERRTEDVYSLSLLQPLMIGYPYLSFTGAALRPYALVHIINDILSNDRQKIIEFGAGISTILLARMIKINDLNTKIISVDHDESWLKYIKNRLEREGLSEIASTIYVPLKECDFALDGNHWYETDALNNKIKDLSFDMIVVDGPPAFEEHKMRARYPALPFMINRLQERASVYLDDANRFGERSVIETWAKEYDMRFMISGSSIAYSYRGDAFFTDPLKSY